MVTVTDTGRIVFYLAFMKVQATCCCHFGAGSLWPMDVLSKVLFTVRQGDVRQIYPYADSSCYYLCIQSNFNGSNTFGTMKISSRQG